MRGLGVDQSRVVDGTAGPPLAVEVLVDAAEVAGDLAQHDIRPVLSAELVHALKGLGFQAIILIHVHHVLTGGRVRADVAGLSRPAGVGDREDTNLRVTRPQPLRDAADCRRSTRRRRRSARAPRAGSLWDNKESRLGSMKGPGLYTGTTTLTRCSWPARGVSRWPGPPGRPRAGCR